MSAVDLIVSMIPKRPAHKEQHLCADKAYDSEDLREFAASAGYIAHIKINPRRKDAAEGAQEEAFCGSAQQTDTVKVPREFMERLTDAVCYAA